MLVFTVEHKYTKMLRHIEGVNVIDAFKKSGTDLALWMVIEVEGAE